MSTFFLALILLSVTAESQNLSEKSKLDRISGIEGKRRFVLDPNEKADWCAALLRGIRSGNGVRPVEPHARPAMPEDPVFDRYQVCDPRKPEREYRDFRVYRFDVEAEPDLRGEELVYGEVDWDKAYSNQGPGYSIVDLSTCGYTQFIHVQQAKRYEGRTLETINVLVQYDKRHYVLSLADMRSTTRSTPWYRIELLPVGPKSAPGPACSWSASDWDR